MKTERETLQIPHDIREAIDERDGGFCRCCGKFLGERRAIHHIWFGGDTQGFGGRRHHAVENLISLCWAPGDMGCHERVHANKQYWQPYLAEVITCAPNLTAMQLARWNSEKKRNS